MVLPALSKKALWTVASSTLSFIFLILAMLLGDSRPAYTLPIHKVTAIPAFARKYGLPCSACHEAWPKLNNFGMRFRDNGYQLMNDRDSPIWQNPSYWPVAMRITPYWHRESADHVPVDTIPGNGTSGTSEITMTSHGFDLSGLDLWTAGTLYKNISFSLLPSSDENASFHFENAFVRFDNIFGSSWLNFKFGKFELNNLISEKRFLFLSAQGGLYQVYHFATFEENNAALSGVNPLNPGFGIGDNQLGIELMGHNDNSYTRYSVALLSSNDGNVDIPNRTYDTYLTFDQAFSAGRLGVQRVGAFAYIGLRPTYGYTSGGTLIPGEGLGNKGFYRAGFTGDWYAGKFDFQTVFMHGWDNAYLGTVTPANQPLPAGGQAPTWNGGFVETHYTVNPKWILLNRYEIVRVSRQAFASDARNLGDLDTYSFGSRYYPIMYSRAGLALHAEYAITKSQATGPLGEDVWASSLFIGFDFDF